MSKVPEPTHVASKREKVLSVLIGVGCIIALYRLIPMLIFEINPLHHGGDGLIYTTVGRGITQGLIPYKDLFEFKPPGMFLIVALSLLTTKGMGLANAIQASAELGIIIILQLFAWRRVRREISKRTRFNYLGGIFIISTLLLLQLVDRAGHFQTESIGTCFILLYAYLVTGNKSLQLTRTVVSALILMLAIGIKEPFVFTGLCVLILLLPPKEALKKYAISLGIAFVVGVILLIVFGYLIPYLTIYLPELLGPRLNYWKDPWWSNGFSLQWIIEDLWSFSPPLFIATTLGIIGSTISLADIKIQNEKWGLLIFMALCAFLWWTITRVILAHVAGHDELDSLFPTIAVLTTVYASAIYAGYRRYYPDSYRHGLSAILKTYGGMFIIAVTVSLGGHLPQQFGFGTAFYALSFIICLSGVISVPSKLLLRLFSVAVLMSCIGLILPLPRQNFSQLLKERAAFNVQQEKSAKIIDDIMDACHYDRYVIIGEPPVPWGFTKHTPYGPAFSRASFTYPVDWREPPIAFLQDKYLENLKKASILVTPKRESVLVDLKDVPQNIVLEFAQHFEINPPDCAKPFIAKVKDENYLMFFRKSTVKTSPGK